MAADSAQDFGLEKSERFVRDTVERGISKELADQVIRTGASFKYFHGGEWKTGFYDAASKVFIGTVNNVATAINNVRPQYIENLKGAGP